MVLSLLSSKNELILLHKTMEKPKRAKIYDIMLSPQFYVIKKEKLPIKYAYQAKKLAPSILDDLIDFAGRHETIVLKNGDTWSFIAYSPIEIEKQLFKFKINANQIGNIYFIDQIAREVKGSAINLDDYNAITFVDGYATVVPKSMLKSKHLIRFKSNLRPKKSFSYKSSKVLRSGNSTISTSAIVASILIAMLGGAFVFEGYDYKKDIAKKEDKLTAILDNSAGMGSKLTRDSIKQKYESKEKEQRAIRELLSTFSGLSSKRSILQSLKMEGGKLSAVFSVDSKEIKHFKALASTKNLTYKQSGDKIRVEGRLK